MPGILDDAARALQSEERSVLGRLRELLAAHAAAEVDLQRIRQAEADLDELFLLVVVGEFNAGKSAFINALVGASVMREGVTPTTAAITRLRFSATQHERRDGPLVEVGYPLELLRDVAVVDTPGTNAVLREHEEITSHFIPRADLVLFVTSADRPFTETERAFMERIRDWGKKVVVILNKADLLATEADLNDQVAFVQQSVERLLGFSPRLFPVSARLALAARNASSPEERERLWQASQFGPLEHFVGDALDERSRLRLKLATPLGVAERVSRTYAMAAQEKMARLADDIALADSIQLQLDTHREDMQRELQPRLERIQNILHELSARGLAYLDETLRIGRVVDLFRQKRLQEEFERVVTADTAERIDRGTQELIDWMVDQDVKLWRRVTEQIEQRRRTQSADTSAHLLAGSFEYDRRAVLGSVGQAARDVVARHDHRRQAEQLAAAVRETVTHATLIEGGALGLGAITMAIAGSAAADVTGLLAASVLAGVGFWVLPRRRKAAKEQFRARTEELRTRLLNALSDEFERELDRSLQRIKDALAPYDRLVRGEHERTARFSQDLEALLVQLRALGPRVEALAPPTA